MLQGCVNSTVFVSPGSRVISFEIGGYATNACFWFGDSCVIVETAEILTVDDSGLKIVQSIV